MRDFGIPYDERRIAGGNAKNPVGRPRKYPLGREISPTTVTQLNRPIVVSAATTSTASHPVPKSDFSGPAEMEAAPGSEPEIAEMELEATEQGTEGATKAPSPLDVLSTVASRSSSPVDFTGAPAAGADGKSKPHKTRWMCGHCEACLRDDCGKCKACIDKPKFGGKGTLRSKCLLRKCPHALQKPKDSEQDKAAPAGNTRTRSSSVSERKSDIPNLPGLASEKRWRENLEHLRPCIKPDGLLDYSVIPNEQIRGRVKSWVKEQRKAYRFRVSGEKTNMTDERFGLLQEAKFPFTFKHSIADKFFERSELTTVATMNAASTGPTSSLDALCMVTSQSFDAMDVAEDEDVDFDNEEEAAPVPDADDAALKL